MSFSFDIKNEVSKLTCPKHCAKLELLAIINYSSKVKKRSENYLISICSENKIVVNRAVSLLKILFKNYNLKLEEENKFYNINEVEVINNIIKTLNLYIKDELIFNYEPINKFCCKRAYIRGAFISAGYISNPNKTYHLEFLNQTLKQAKFLQNVINSFDISAKVIQKKNDFIVYIKESEQIVDLLNIIGAHKALLELEEIRVVKEVRNNINRIVNCETANLSKVVSNGIKQKDDIKLIEEEIGLENLPKGLKDVAKLRLKYPDISLKELSQMLTPTMSKSGINHRLKKLSDIARSLREVNYE